jgi:spore germination cell wall hydrolase CwlJ-like protein
MYRPGDDVLLAGIEGYDRTVGMRAAKWLLLLCLAWLALLISTPPIASHRGGFAPMATTIPKAKPRVLPPLPVPEVETAEPMALTPDEARRFNATVPFIDGPISPARKFAYAGSREDRERALTCLASAAWYEAGDDKVGEQAVVQVVLNRTRHPAFPKTICGVVFEGTSRKTGCQFTFTCDGALRREPSADAWQRARAIADRALSGYVFKKVGNATHYHADWVVPYWSDTLDKLAGVDGHIFYRWRGDWGKAAAFSQHPGGIEELDPRIADLADPKLLPQAVEEKLTEKGSAQPAAGVILAKTPDGRQHLIAPAASPTQTTILPLSPAAVRQILPPVTLNPAPPAPDPATIRYRLPPQQEPRRQMSFNRQAEPAGHEAAR